MIKVFLTCALLFLISSAFAGEGKQKTTRDLITRITEVNCAGDGHDLEMKWDTAVTPLGPTEIVLDGRNIPIGGLKMSFAQDGSTYETHGLQITMKHSDKNKKSFTTAAQYNGRSISLKCANHESTKFFRKRNVESSSPSNSGGVK